MYSKPILLVDLAKGYGGVETRVIEMARGLHGKRDYAVAVLDQSPVHQRLVDEGLNVETIHHKKRDPRNLFALLNIIRKGGYQVVDAHNDQSCFWGLGAAWLANVPVKISSVQLPCRLTPGGIRGRLQEWILVLNRMWGCRFMVVNENLVEYVKGLGVAEHNIALIYNTITFEAEVDLTPKLNLRQEIGWPDDTVIFANIARLVPQKAQDILLRSVAQAVKKEPRIRCVFVGQGKLEKKLKALTHELGITDYVSFLGFRNDIPEILKSIDVFCLPSRSEGLPLALLEANAYQKPVLVSDIDGMGELYTHMETAYLVPADEIEPLVDGLIWHVEELDSARQIGKQAYAYVQRRLSPKVMIDQTLDFYEEKHLSMHTVRLNG